MSSDGPARWPTILIGQLSIGIFEDGLFLFDSDPSNLVECDYEIMQKEEMDVRLGKGRIVMTQSIGKEPALCTIKKE